MSLWHHNVRSVSMRCRGQKTHHEESNNINNRGIIGKRAANERMKKKACKIHCCVWPYQNGSGWNECVCFQFGLEMRNFNLTTSLSRENITQFLFIRCPCILHKCAPKILIKFIYINAVQFFRIVVWFARREVWKGAQGKGKKEQQHNTSACMAKPIALSSKTFRTVQLKLNLMISKLLCKRMCGC